MLKMRNCSDHLVPGKPGEHLSSGHLLVLLGSGLSGEKHKPQWGEAQETGALGETSFLRKEGLQFVEGESQLIRGGWLVCCWRTSLTISRADF